VTSSVIRYGELSEVPVGSVFPSRRALRDAGVHRPLQAGIDFAAGQAASSVVLSGVYPDDDQGDVVIYHGSGRTSAWHVKGDCGPETDSRKRRFDPKP
jgi:hypothetical protein